LYEIGRRSFKTAIVRSVGVRVLYRFILWTWSIKKKARTLKGARNIWSTLETVRSEEYMEHTRDSKENKRI